MSAPEFSHGPANVYPVWFDPVTLRAIVFNPSFVCEPELIGKTDRNFSNPVQRLVQVRDQIIRVFDPDG